MPDLDVRDAVVAQLLRWFDDDAAELVPALQDFERLPEAMDAAVAEKAARSILAAIGFGVGEQQVLSPQGASSGMFSRRLAHVRLDLSTLNAAHPAAAVIVHEAAHCLDQGPYDFDHPWSTTPEQRLQALTAQLVACFSSHTFTSSVLGLDPGRGQLALARQVVGQLAASGAAEQAVAQDAGQRVGQVTQLLREALLAPPWTHRPER
ncbi:hypothetical protein ACFV9C_12860 [Kribbella sp. NPDC059898]|uniref:hypothetical protein n=1 Tax=Kribbella sp. NPDC059898 TaxID=3346995 RepID=UPI0036480F47